MAGINVKQFQVFKIGTDILKMSDWDLKISKDKVGQALSILLATDKIKLVDKKEVLIYQHIKGNKVGIPIYKEPDKNYTTLKDYLKINEIKKYPKELKEKLDKEKNHSRLFQSSQGIVKEYEISYLQKIIQQNVMTTKADCLITSQREQITSILIVKKLKSCTIANYQFFYINLLFTIPNRRIDLTACCCLFILTTFKKIKRVAKKNK